LQTANEKLRHEEGLSMKRQVVGSALLAIAGIAAMGCTESQVEGGVEPQIGSQQQELIGGFPANSPALDAIGTIGFLSTYTDCYTGEVVEYYEYFCTASLINTQTVLTAKHCQDLLAYASDNFEPVFAVGPDTAHPKRMVKIVDSQKNPVNDGGFVGYGRDVATVHLETPITDIKPLKFATLDASKLGTTLVAVGYGVQDNSGTSGTRMSGNLRVNALEGKIFELMFGSFEAFKEWVNTGDVPEPEEPGEEEEPSEEPGDVGGDDGSAGDDGSVEDDGSVDGGSDDDWYDEYLRDIYENTYLLPGYEVYVGNAPGNAQPCFGDSGGPLLKKEGADFVAYGVTSGGLGTNQLICDRGAVYAAFGAQTKTWLTKANKWTDVCTGITTKGICDGDVAIRCSALDEGKRRSLVQDCSLLDQTCAVDANGEAVCVPPGEEPVVIAPPVDFCDYYGDDDGSGDGDGDGEMSLRDRLKAVQAQAQSTYIGPLGNKP
jgi:hypothetical protein